jgi:hypothetical protein
MKKVSAAFVSLLFSSVALAQGVAPPRAKPYDAIVAHFETSHGETSLEALLRLGMENKVALGIVRTDNRLCKNAEDVTIDNQPFLNAANTLLKSIDGYQAVVRDGVIVIEPRTASPNSEKILNLVIGQYVAQEGSSMQELGVYLWRYVYDILHPEASTMIEMLSGTTVPIPPFEMHNATVEQILNRIVKEVGGGVWVLPPIPDDYRNKRDLRIADVSSYTDDVEKIRKISFTCNSKSSQ